jgi:hypothetical protein
MTQLDPQALLDSVVPFATTGLSAGDAARMRDLLAALVRDWQREAGTDADAPAVIAMLRKDFETALAGKSGATRLDAVNAQVVERELRRLGAQTFALGKQLIDGSVARDDGKARGQALLKELEGVGTKVRAVADVGLRDQLARDLQEASLEALYAVEGKAMSLRLNHYASDAQAPHVS